MGPGDHGHHGVGVRERVVWEFPNPLVIVISLHQNMGEDIVWGNAEDTKHAMFG